MKFIQMTGKYGRFKYAMVDDEDFDELIKYRWWCDKKGYALRSVNGSVISMHRMVMGAEKGQIVDHINHETLDNRKSNLRFCTSSQNQCNTLPRVGNKSKYKGVSYWDSMSKWGAYIQRNKQKMIHLGFYESEVDAAHAYDLNAIEMFGEFACLNFPEFDYSNYITEPYEKDASSIYRGVSIIKSTGKWRSRVQVNGKLVHYRDGFISDVDAAHDYDVYVIENNLPYKLNFPNFDYNNYSYEIPPTITKKRKNNKISQYLGVGKQGNKWKVTLTVNKQLYYKGGFATEEDAARHFDEYVKNNHLNYELNFPEENL